MTCHYFYDFVSNEPVPLTVPICGTDATPDTGFRSLLRPNKDDLEIIHRHVEALEAMIRGRELV